MFFRVMLFAMLFSQIGSVYTTTQPYHISRDAVHYATYKLVLTFLCMDETLWTKP